MVNIVGHANNKEPTLQASGIILRVHIIYQLTLERKKNHARTLYQHECEHVIQMLNTADREPTHTI